MWIYDDWLIEVTESEWQELLLEGEKSIATHLDAPALSDRLGGSFKTLPKNGVQWGKTERLIQLKRNYRDTLHSVFKRVYRKEIGEAQTEKLLRNVFNHYFKRAYALGLKSQGVGTDLSLKEIIKQFQYEDHYHVKTMIDEEIKYVRVFIKAIQERSFPRVPYPKRLMLYINGLDGIYTGARVSALESNTLLYWTGPHDKNKCASCTYLVKASPFLPENLPTTPRAGDTLCLSKCRDRIVARKGAIQEVTGARQGLGKKQHVSNLGLIKKKRKRVINPPHLRIPMKGLV